ncbi:hypothetical protein LOK49_LG02G01759 [Camellia lanceoleosa]|uniref:Uncharacterized protein n=1 Tax=Camellia lanceoleosa TaxID=1840588 RepID=A0ACC0IRL6_9ERIC|nr:hypothetical protein LOK49_LG02G01759 [Camellia lanceoleosa]
MRSTSSSRLIASPLILQPITPPKHKPSKPIFLTTTTPKTLTLICRIENRPTTNKTTMDNPKSNKPTRTRNPRKSSYGTSRRSIIKKSFSQEQVMFTGPLSDDPIIAIIGGGMSGLVCALNLEKRGIRSTVFDTVGQFFPFFALFLIYSTI